MLSCRPCNLASVLIWLSFAPEFLGILSIIAALRFALLSKDSAGAELLQLSWQRILQSEDKPRYSESPTPPGTGPASSRRHAVLHGSHDPLPEASVSCEDKRPNFELKAPELLDPNPQVAASFVLSQAIRNRDQSIQAVLANSTRQARSASKEHQGPPVPLHAVAGLPNSQLTSRQMALGLKARCLRLV